MWMRSAATLTGETGTYVYMAPEMIRHELYTSKADVYSWGVLLAECLAQRPPYEGMYLTPVQVLITPPLEIVRMGHDKRCSRQTGPYSCLLEVQASLYLY